MSVTIRTRMAPSPTGEYHVGHIATLLKNYAFAKQHGGQFVLRIEDTDQERKVEGAVEKILKVIKAYGLGWDEGPDIGGPYAPYTQSERLPLYKEKALELVKSGNAYFCFCSHERIAQIRDQLRAENIPPKYDRHCRYLSSEEVQAKLSAGESSVVRLAVPDNQPITFTDWMRGDITVNSDVVDDQVLLKSDGFPTYHLAVIVDDHLMKITHIMRGEEWISSTPKHVLLYRAFKWDAPIYAHMPVFLNPDGKGKMSKRRGTVAAQSFLDDGYLPEAMLNFFMILGWTPEDQREILTLDEYIQEFDPRKMSSKSVVFDLEKLRWLNGLYIRRLTTDELKKRLEPYIPDQFPRNKFAEILPLVMERLVVLKDFDSLTNFFYQTVRPDKELLLKKATPELLTEQLTATEMTLAAISSWHETELENAIRKLQEEKAWHKGQYFMMLRLAVTGKTATPPLFETMRVIGQETIMSRLQQARKLVTE